VWIALLALLVLAGCGEKPFTVCADPNNMPFSNRGREGLENKLAELLAKDMGKPLKYVWWKQRRGWIRNTLGEGKCEAWMGVPSTLEAVATTRPYYRSGYVFVSRADAPLAGLTLDDPRLRKLTIGVQLAGDDGANPPPADALARRGLAGRMRGFMLYGDNRQRDPTADIVRAVARGDVDVALVWGPLAGWHAAGSPVPLRLEPVTPWLDQGRWPMVFDISIGVAKDNPELRKKLDIGLLRNRAAIADIVAAFHVPPAPSG
jgi:mxaJ protein